jgi:hypothetical protein
MAAALATATAAGAPDFDALVRQGLGLLPFVAPEWSDHNASDPGVTLVELLAYVADALLYRAAHVGTADRRAFLRLLRGTAEDDLALDDDPLPLEGAALHAALAGALAAVAEPDVVVTPADAERLALGALAGLPHAEGVRVLALPRTNLPRLLAHAPGGPAGRDAGHLSLVVFAAPATPEDATRQMLDVVRDHLEPRRLLTSRVHVLEPLPLHLAVRVHATPAAGADRHQLRQRIALALADASPASSPPLGPTGDDAAPPGGRLLLSDLIERVAAVEGVEGVDRVALVRAATEAAALVDPAAAIGLQAGVQATIGLDTRLGGPAALTAGRLVRDGDGALAAFELRAWERPTLWLRPEDLVWQGAEDDTATRIGAGGER